MSMIVSPPNLTLDCSPFVFLGDVTVMSLQYLHTIEYPNSATIPFNQVVPAKE